MSGVGHGTSRKYAFRHTVRSEKLGNETFRRIAFREMAYRKVGHTLKKFESSVRKNTTTVGYKTVCNCISAMKNSFCFAKTPEKGLSHIVVYNYSLRNLLLQPNMNLIPHSSFSHLDLECDVPP